MKTLSIFLLAVGCIWALFEVWLFLTLAGISEPVSIAAVVSYWGSMLIGPLTLMAGAVVLLRGTSPKYGVALIAIGCLILTGFALYNSVVGMQRKALQAPPLYAFYVVLLVIMLLSDVAAYKIYKQVSSSRAVTR